VPQWALIIPGPSLEAGVLTGGVLTGGVLTGGVLTGGVLTGVASPLTAPAVAGTAVAGPAVAGPAVAGTAVAGTAVSAGSRAWLAGNPGPPPSSASVVPILTILALALAVLAVGARPRQHHEAPLRKQMHVRPETYRAAVDVRASFLDMMLPVKGPLHLVVRGDAFEVAHFFPSTRSVFGQRYCYRAEDTTIKVVTGLRHDWIEIDAQPARTAVRIWIWRQGMNRQIWNVLTGAGAHPIGPAPPP
jgi:hypothetical protein